MPIRTQIKIFISCPEDVEEEKLIAIEECKKLAKLFSSRFILEVVEWKQNTVPLITGEGAQSVINDQIKDEYDIYIGILWKHFGVKQENGLTPTEEEFERAFNRYKNTKKPLISVYFKTNDLVENETEQILEVKKFKEKIKRLGIYFDFKAEDFKNKISQDIAYKIINWFSLTSIHLEKPKEENKNYLQRKVVSIKDYNSSGLFLPGESGDLLDIVEKQHRIVLLGDAGIGKTTELKRIDWYFSKPDSPLVPFFLPLNKYVNQDISELLGNTWTTNPEDRILVILDGLDEIEAKNKNDAIRKIEFFAEQHQLCKILISSRKNFYNQEKGEEAGTINGFLSYVLLDLDYKEIQRYIGMVLESKAESFFEAVQNGWLGSLLKVPFYLVSLVKLFKQNENKLPENKSQIFEYLLNDRLNLDSNHFHATIDVKVNKGKIQFALQRLGLAMNMLGRNYISEEEYVEIIPTDELRNLLSYCTAWTRNDGTIVTWQFEHNNFQEYLSARALSNKPLDIIKECISFKPEYKRIIPFWGNTLSFLINMSNNEQLLSWIMEIQPELIVKIEPNRIEKKVRISIFEQIFNEYGQKKTWIPFDKYDLRELARFGQSEETVKFLMNEVEKATHYTTCCNAIELLGYSETQFYRDEIRNLLLKVVIYKGIEKFSKQETEQIQAQALIALARFGLNSREVVDQIVNYLVSTQSDQLRYGLYYLIQKSDYLDDYIDIFLDGIKNAEYDLRNDDEIHRLGLSEERSNLLIGLQKARSQESIKKILEYLIKNNGKLSHHSLLDKSLANIAENAASSQKTPLFSG